MENIKRSTKEQYWTVRVGNFPEEKRIQIQKIAASNRQSVASFIGSLLDKVLEQKKTN